MPESRRHPAVSAHRGGSEDAAAATMEAYEAAVDSGAEYVELDIRRTADGTFVNYHDDRVDHVGPRLGELTYPEVVERAGYPVPRVPDILETLAGRAVGHLDLKEIGDESEVVEMALDVLGVGNFVATTLEDVSVRRIKDRYPQVTTALSLGRDMTGESAARTAWTRSTELYPLPRLRRCGADWVAVHHRLARATVLRLCARHGIPAMVWTVNDAALVEAFLARDDVEVLITDRPRHAISVRDALSDHRL